jgi:acetyl esterase/lipase
MRTTAIFWALTVAIGTAACGRAAEQPAMIDLWPGQVPGETGPAGEEKLTGEKGSRRLTDVSRPTITVFRPAKEKNTGVAVLIAPGGGYNFLAWDHEGEDVAAWLNSIGVTGAVLKYRVPRRPDHPRYPLQDAQRALSLLRSKAPQWGIDPHRVGMLGFSAGGHLTAVTETNSDKRAYEPIDAADQQSCRPDFAVVVYPGGVVNRGSSELVPAVHVTKDAPPTFLIQAGDDRVGVENSVMLYLALKRAGVPAELHVYAAGGHGFGLRPSKLPASQWPKRCEEWLRAQGILGPAAKQ